MLVFTWLSIRAPSAGEARPVSAVLEPPLERVRSSPSENQLVVQAPSLTRYAHSFFTSEHQYTEPDRDSTRVW